MTRRWNSVLTTGLVLLLSQTGLAQQATNPTKEVTKRVASYVDAFNRRDVSAAAEHWSENGEYIVADAANPIVGREAIGKALGKLLATDEQFQLTVENQRYRNVADDVVMEEGIARLVSETHGSEYARYLVVHVKQNGKWYRDSIRETVVRSWPSSAPDPNELSALVGSWKRKSNGGTLTVQAVWKHDKRFIERSFQILGKDGQKITATEMIGWDPATRTIRSWSFDSQGGFEQAVWNRDGDSWLIKADAVLPGGITATEQRSLSLDSEGNLRIQTLEQQSSGRLMPGFDPITLVRQSSQQLSNKKNSQEDTR